MEEVETMNTELVTPEKRGWRSDSGRSIIEVLIVVAIGAVLMAVTLPQMISARRLIRTAQLPQEIVTQLRLTRQRAMSERQPYTFQYDDANKRIVIIDHGPTFVGTAVLGAPGYPNTAGSTTVLTLPITGGPGIPSADLSYGVPTGVPGTATTLDDTATPTALPANNRINITFQPDGSVINAAGNPDRFALFFFNNKAAKETSFAISVLGAAGRVKVWRYDTSASRYAE
jgi:type II secretory pathway pseudopilin PulG